MFLSFEKASQFYKESLQYNCCAEKGLSVGLTFNIIISCWGLYFLPSFEFWHSSVVASLKVTLDYSYTPYANNAISFKWKSIFLPLLPSIIILSNQKFIGSPPWARIARQFDKWRSIKKKIVTHKAICILPRDKETEKELCLFCRHKIENGHPRRQKFVTSSMVTSTL